ncbi:hypothetical protein BS47DRAFT_1347858 [Hydnum rufescens UP504]|uniref:Uncharacterized protein n=1 Tax=Hydnum rufescens UP504 TaxID=1448309 RepID=A0A9P6ARV5_9AGAM|nr:hypothetical protein BS47DRAFT_1347858 [Hydnum rufescens UP504]
MAKLAAGNAPNGFRVGDWCLSMISKLGGQSGVDLPELRTTHYCGLNPFSGLSELTVLARNTRERTQESLFWVLNSAQYRYSVLDLSTA